MNRNVWSEQRPASRRSAFGPTATPADAVRDIRFRSIRDVVQRSQMRKLRSLGDGESVKSIQSRRSTFGSTSSFGSLALNI